MAKKGYKVCWWFMGRPHKTCRVLSSKQHRNGHEAATTVLMQNPGAFVQVISPRGGGRGTTYIGTGGKVRKIKESFARMSRGVVF